MKFLTIRGSVLDRVEITTSLLLTALAVFLHVQYLTHAGPLWRDEINGVAVATHPSWAGVWRSLEFESFPILYFVALRIWWYMGMGGIDFEWRIFGFLAGLSVLAALWLSRRLMNATAPLLSLALLAMSPAVLRWGDSLRAWRTRKSRQRRWFANRIDA